MLAPAELDVALVEVARRDFGGSPEELVQEAARLLGLKAVGAQFRDSAKARVQALEAEGGLVRAGDVLVVPAAPTSVTGPRPGTTTVH